MLGRLLRGLRFQRRRHLVAAVTSVAAVTHSLRRADAGTDDVERVLDVVDHLTADDGGSTGLSACELEYLRHFSQRATIRRYLLAHGGNVRAAVSALIATVRWRIVHSVDLLSAESLRDKIVDVNMYVSSGRDRDGRPIIINHKSASKEDDFDRAFMQIVYTMERAIASMAAATDDERKWVWLLHMASFSTASAAPITHSIDVVRVLTLHYPERLHRAVIINAPPTLLYVSAVVKWIIPRSTAAKIYFVTTDTADEYTRAQSVITQFIDAEQLETTLGGTKTFALQEYIRSDPLPALVQPYMTAAIAEYEDQQRAR